MMVMWFILAWCSLVRCIVQCGACGVAQVVWCLWCAGSVCGAEGRAGRAVVKVMHCNCKRVNPE